MTKKVKLSLKECKKLFPIICQKLIERYQYQIGKEDIVCDAVGGMSVEYYIPLVFGKLRIFIYATRSHQIKCAVLLSGESYVPVTYHLQWLEYTEHVETCVLNSANQVDDFVEQIYQNILKFSNQLKRISNAFARDAKKLKNT